MFLISLSRDGERLTLRNGILRKPDKPAFRVTEETFGSREGFHNSGFKPAFPMASLRPRSMGVLHFCSQTTGVWVFSRVPGIHGYLCFTL